MLDTGIEDQSTHLDSCSTGSTEEPGLEVLEYAEGTCLVWRDESSEIVATVKEEEKKAGLVEEKRFRVEVQKKERKDPTVRDTLLSILEKEHKNLRMDVKILLNVDILSGDPFPGVIVVINEILKIYKVCSQDIEYTVEEQKEPIGNLCTDTSLDAMEIPMARITRTIKRNRLITQKVMVVEVDMV